jgi:heme/copper-type cytochrome/quinol oxidase subunit 1
MLPAKLFVVLAIIFSIFAGLAWLKPLPSASVDFYLSGTYFVFGPVLVLLFCAVTSANFAVLYYAAARIFHARWNRTLSVLHFSLFVCFGISLSVVFVVSTRAANSSDMAQAFRWLITPWLLGILSFVVCFVVFGVNLTLTIAQIVRARFAIH